MDKKEKPTFSQNLFWDVDINQVDIDKTPEFVIARVLENGSLEDWHKIRAYFSLDQIRKAVTEIRSLEPTAMTFASVVTHTPIEYFQCYKFRQSNPELSFY